jgi:DNA-binding MarR family transcriptional regulator
VDADEAVRLRRAISRLARQFNTSATDEDLTPTQASVLALIVGRGPIGVAELVQLEHINPTMLSRVVGALADAGAISRTPDPNDLRSIRVEVTEHGRTIHERIKAKRAAAVSAGLEHLTTAEQSDLVNALRALEHLADALGPG